MEDEVNPKFRITDHVTGMDGDLKAEIETARIAWEAANGQKLSDDYEAMQRASALRELFRVSGMNERDRPKTFDTFEVTEQNETGYRLAKAYAEGWPESAEGGAGIILMGDLGVGKTHLGLAVLNHMIWVQGVDCEYANAKKTLDAAKETFDTDGTSPIPRMKRRGLLLLDDLGSQRSTDWSLDAIAEIIVFRHEEYLPTMYTTNANSWERLVKVLSPRGGQFSGERLVERIMERCEVAKILGESRRRPRRRLLTRR